MPSYYENLVAKLGESEAKAHMKEVASKRTVFKGGAFRDKDFAKQAQLKSAKSRRENNAKAKQAVKGKKLTQEQQASQIQDETISV
jgi:hypothetical protein